MQIKEKILFCWSGGKDCALALEQVQRCGRYEIAALLTTVTADYDANKIVVHSTILLQNCGRTEGKDIELSYVITHDGKERAKTIEGPFQYLYPEQTANISITTFNIPVSAESIKIVKQAADSGQSITVPKDYVKPVSLDIELAYEDLDGNKTKTPYSFQYIFSMNKWVYSRKELGVEID